MGMYDTVMVPCPACGKVEEVQSKAGLCDLEEYTLDEAPDEVLASVLGSKLLCLGCGSEFMLGGHVVAVVRLTKRGAKAPKVLAPID